MVWLARYTLGFYVVRAETEHACMGLYMKTVMYSRLAVLDLWNSYLYRYKVRLL